MYFFTFIYIANRVVSDEIYTAGKSFTLPPGVTGVTNSTSGLMYNANVLLVCALGVFHNRDVVHLLHVNQNLHAGHLKREQESRFMVASD